jgi:hypothetical protein
VNNGLEQTCEERPLFTVSIPARDEEKAIFAAVK